MPLGVQPRDTSPPAKTAAANGAARSGVPPAPSGPVVAKAGDHSPRGLLAEAQWLRSMPDCQPPAPWRWRHAGLEELLARHVDLSGLLTDHDAVVAANATIGLGRSGGATSPGAKEVGRRLAGVVRAGDLPTALRAAAVETLAALPSPVAARPLAELTDEFGDPGPAGTATYCAVLHAELIRGLARHVDAAADPRLSAALAGPSAEVRIEALDAWAGGRGGILPREAAELRSDGNAHVRAAALRAMTARRHPQVHRALAEALRDAELSVRLAAITALGELGDGQALATLADVLKDRSERIRAEAVSALGRAGAKPTVLAAASDAAWQVRLRVARAVAAWPDRDGISVARRLLDDPSAEVEQSVAVAVGQWPLAQGGPVLLEALGKPAFSTRQAALKQLATQWPAARDFPVEAADPYRQEALARLQARFQREVVVEGGATPLAAARGPLRAVSQPPPDPASLQHVEALLRAGDIQALVQWGPSIVSLLEHLATAEHRVLPEDAYRNVLPQHSPAFAALLRLKSPNPIERRGAATELAALAQKQPLSALAVARLCESITPETDALVWQGGLEAVAGDASEPAARMASLALGHASAEVRRRGCEHLAAHPAAAYAGHLVPLLQDTAQGVVIAAIRALGAMDSFDDLRPLRQMLAANDEEIQLEASAVLARCRDPAGAAALDRLTYSDDPRIRTRTAQVMGDLGDRTFAAALVRLLDDRWASVAHAALAALPKVAGRDVAQTADRNEQTRRWKQWLAMPR
jgi:HEAT repeat protein